MKQTSENPGFWLDELWIVEEDEPSVEISVDVNIFDDELAGDFAAASATLVSAAAADVVANW